MIANTNNIKPKILLKKLNYELRGEIEIENLCGYNTYCFKMHSLFSKILVEFNISLLEAYYYEDYEVIEWRNLEKERS